MKKRREKILKEREERKARTRRFQEKPYKQREKERKLKLMKQERKVRKSKEWRLLSNFCHKRSHEVFDLLELAGSIMPSGKFVNPIVQEFPTFQHPTVRFSWYWGSSGWTDQDAEYHEQQVNSEIEFLIIDNRIFVKCSIYISMKPYTPLSGIEVKYRPSHEVLAKSGKAPYQITEPMELSLFVNWLEQKITSLPL